MAIGDTRLKKLYQGSLSAAVTAKYTCPAGYQALVAEIWLDNQNSTAPRYISLYAHGLNAVNRLANRIAIPALSSTSISDNKIILDAGEVFALMQDAGTDVNCTIYGYEEAIA